MHFHRVPTSAQIQSIIAPQYFIPQYYNPRLLYMAELTQHDSSVVRKLFNPISGEPETLDTLLAGTDKISG